MENDFEMLASSFMDFFFGGAGRFIYARLLGADNPRPS
jgi:hypothetical protein